MLIEKPSLMLLKSSKLKILMEMTLNKSGGLLAVINMLKFCFYLVFVNVLEITVPADKV